MSCITVRDNVPCGLKRNGEGGRNIPLFNIMKTKMKGIMQVDLNNDLAKRYLEHSLKSFERVEDIFEIEVVQCLTPDDNYYPNLLDPKKKRSPQEVASLLSNYRMVKRIADGERMFVLEGDAFLIPEREDIFRMVMSKYHLLAITNMGIANEFYTCMPEIAKIYCYLVETDNDHKLRGPMSFLHSAGDMYSNGKSRQCYWPKKGQTNETGIGFNVTSAFNKPVVTIDAPITQCIDVNHGSTVTDRPNINSKYTEETHPNFHWINLD